MIKLRNIGTCGSDPKSGRFSLLQLPPSPHVSHFSLYGCCLLQMQVWGGGPQLLYWGETAAPLPGGRGLGGRAPQTGGRPPAALLPGGRDLYVIKI